MNLSKVRAFVSYDAEHDHDLLDQLVLQASEPNARFEIVARSIARSANDLWDEELQRSIGNAELLIVLCGEHTADSGRMGAELRVAHEADLPCLMLWGRREAMCTRPSTARPSDTMFSWTTAILEDQIQLMRRTASANERAAARLARPPRR